MDAYFYVFGCPFLQIPYLCKNLRDRQSILQVLRVANMPALVRMIFPLTSAVVAAVFLPVYYMMNCFSFQ